MVIRGDSSFTILDDASVVQPLRCGTHDGDSSKPPLDGYIVRNPTRVIPWIPLDVTTTQLLDHVTGIIGV